MIVLLTDGEETCGGATCAVAKDVEFVNVLPLRADRDLAALEGVGHDRT